VLGRLVANTPTYTDERGEMFEIRSVGVLAGAILQANILTSEEAFTDRFSSKSRYRLLRLDAPVSRTAGASKTLSSALEDIGLELTPAA